MTEDGLWGLTVLHKPRYDITYEVYVYNNQYLAALLPPKTANIKLKNYPQLFKLHQDAEDGIVLLFKEEDLEQVADIIKIKRRKRLSRKQFLALKPYQYSKNPTG